jgi:putative Mg2+ transporter-C (MgtC) family protein
MPSQTDLLLRLLLAAALAGALGVERELTEQPAGVRTHILVGLGSALFAVVSAFGFQGIAGSGPAPAVRVDITRVASQIVVGIGFLGGGAIIKYGGSVRGLTTAASLWVTAAIGTAIGLGALVLGSATTLITLLALVGLRPLRNVLRRYAVGREEFDVEADADMDVDSLLRRIRQAGATVQEVSLSEEASTRRLHLRVQLRRGMTPAEIAAAMSKEPHVRDVDWSR